MQRQLGVDQPDYGALFVHLRTSTGDPVPTAGLLQPRAEAEVVLVLGADGQEDMIVDVALDLAQQADG